GALPLAAVVPEAVALIAVQVEQPSPYGRHVYRRRAVPGELAKLTQPVWQRTRPRADALAELELCRREPPDSVHRRPGCRDLPSSFVSGHEAGGLVGIGGGVRHPPRDPARTLGAGSDGSLGACATLRGQPRLGIQRRDSGSDQYPRGRSEYG